MRDLTTTICAVVLQCSLPRHVFKIEDTGKSTSNTLIMDNLPSGALKYRHPELEERKK